ncbi:MAG: DUF222 domain-containing protein [Ancrocorticia sp.]
MAVDVGEVGVKLRGLAAVGVTHRGENRGAVSFESVARLMDELSEASKRLELESLPECTGFLERLGDLQRSLDGARFAAVSTVARIQKEAQAQPTGQAAKEVKKELGESRTIWDVVEKTGKQSREKTRHDIRRAEAATELYPRFGAALRAGGISVDHLDVLRSVAASPELKERTRADEVALLERALAESPDRFRMTLKAWKFRVSPRAAEQQVKREAREEKVHFFRADEGFRISGWLSALNGTIVDEALRGVVGVPGKDDRRSGAQRTAEALVGMARVVVGMGAGSSGTDGGLGVAGGGAGDAGDIAVSWDGGELTTSSDGAAGGSAGQWVAGRAVDRSTGTKPGTTPATKRSPRFQTLVHVPLSTLVETTKAIERGCDHLHHLERALDVERAVDLERKVDPEGENGARSVLGTPNGESRLSDGGIPTVTNVPRCPVTGSGIGGRGRCLEGREEMTGELHEALGAIRARIKAGVCPDLLEGLPPATLSDGTALAPSQFARMLCDSGISRVVLSAHGEPLDASRAQRRFSVTQEKAILARDRTCRYPGCARGVEYSEIHHAQEWEEGGPTIVDNAVLLCFHHHQHIHSEHIIITHHAGGFVFTKPGGEIVGIRRHEGGDHG